MYKTFFPGAYDVRGYTYTSPVVQLRSFLRKVTVILYEWNRLLFLHRGHGKKVNINTIGTGNRE